MSIIKEIAPSGNVAIRRVVERRKDPLGRVAFDFGFTPAQRVASMEEFVRSIHYCRERRGCPRPVVVVAEGFAFGFIRYKGERRWRTLKWYADPATASESHLRQTLDRAIGTAF